MTTLPHEKQIVEMSKAIAKLQEQNKANPLFSQEEMVKMTEKLEELKESVYGSLSAWDRVLICRHTERPHSLDYIENIMEEFVELFGDRTFRDDPAMITGLAKIQGERFMVVAQEKGNDTESRIERNFGMPHPEGYRKALRCMQLAEKFSIPVLALIDTPGAYPCLAAEERGQGWAIAKNLFEMAKLKVPMITVLIGEGCSGGALGIGMGDVIGMMEHAYYSVISPEGCASILWKDASKNATAASALKMHVEDLLDLGVVDKKIEEPQGGAHLDKKAAYKAVQAFILKEWEALKGISLETLEEKRYQKFRKMGKFDVALQSTT